LLGLLSPLLLITEPLLSTVGVIVPEDGGIRASHETIRVCFVSQALSSGTLKYARDLVSGLSKTGFAVTAISLDSDYGMVAARNRILRLPISPSARGALGRVLVEILRLPFFLPKMVRIIVRERVDILYTQNMDEGAFLCCLAGLLTRTPVILFVQDLTERELYVYERGFPRRVIPILYAFSKIRHKIVSKFSPHLFVASDFIGREIAEYSRDQIRVIPHGVTPPKSLPRRKEARPTFKLVCIGKLETKKRFEVPIRALGEIRNLDVRLTVIGDGPRREYLDRLVRDLGLAGRVDFTGFLSDESVRAELERGDLGVVPSLWEGFGYATVEMMAYGLPVLGSNGGALPEVIKPGYNGYIFGVDNYRELGELIRKVCADPDILPRLQRGALETAQKFNLETMISSTGSAIREVLRAAGP
jgi:glycosyltransferase involved in cell wall biosynthesis